MSAFPVRASVYALLKLFTINSVTINGVQIKALDKLKGLIVTRFDFVIQERDNWLLVSNKYK